MKQWKNICGYAFAVALIVAGATSTVWLPMTGAIPKAQCNNGDLFIYQGFQTCAPVSHVFASGMLIPFTSVAACPSGWSEATDLDGRFPLGTTIAAGDANATGGSSSITPSGSVSQINFTSQNNFGLIGAVSALQSPTSVTPTFTGNAFDPTPLYRKVVWCRRN